MLVTPRYKSIDLFIAPTKYLTRQSKAISRILSPQAILAQRAAAIYLGRRFPGASCDPPGGSRGQRSNAPIFGLAPSGVYLADPVTRAAGELLPHRFTLALTSR